MMKKTSLSYLFLSFLSFLFSFLIAYYTKIDSIVNAVLFAFVLQWVLFLPAYYFQTEKFFDISGSLTYILLITYIFINHYITMGLDYGNVILSFLIVMWALRLGVFLFLRVKINRKDRRFDLIKKSPTKFFMTWTLQGMWVTICSLCALVGIYNGIKINVFFYIGIIIFLIGFLIEVISDYQKMKFRMNPKNKNKFIQSGLWYYSRHPNYLGEIVLWVGISIISLSSLQGIQLITLISPFFTYFLLVYISGVKILEDSAEKKWGHLPSYRNYIKRTPVLFFNKE